MNREDIKKYLRMLGQELQAKQVTGEILVADGVVVLLDLLDPELSDGDDIDTYFGRDGAAIHEAIATIADREGLSHDWLHHALKDFFTQSSREKWLEYPGLRVYLAPTDYVLAMEMAIAGSSQDAEDIKILAEKLRLVSAQDMFSLITQYIREEDIPKEVRRRIRRRFK